MRNESQQLMEKMRRQSKPPSARAQPATTPTRLSNVPPRPMLVVLHEMKQRRDPALVYSSAEAQARHYHDTTGVPESPLSQYLELRHAQTLWDYQRQGVDFMRERETDEAQQGCHGGLLCDEMGMGKTRLILTGVLEDNQRRARASGLRFNGATLLLAPKHLLDHWRQEAASFPQSALVVVELESDGDAYRYTQCDLVIATYSSLADAYKYGETAAEQQHANEALRQRYKTLYGRRWRRVAADEAHQLVVETTLVSRAAHDLNTDCFWPITGTPLQNHLSDVRTLLHIIGYRRPIEESNMNPLLERLMLRRTKEQLAQRQLLSATPLEQAGLLRPPQILIKLVDFANPCERMLYYAYARYALQCRGSKNNRGARPNTPVLIHWLRQLCVAPRLIKDLVAPRGMLLLRRPAASKPPHPSVQSYMDELPLSARYTYAAGAGYSERTIVSFDWEPVTEWPGDEEGHHYALLRDELQQHGTVTERMCKSCEAVPLATSQAMLLSLWDRSLDLRAPSSKERAILQYVKEAPPEDKLVLFAISVRFLQGMQSLLEEHGISSACMHGKQSESVNAAERERFKRSPAELVRILLISLKKGNTGLNLEEANHLLYANEHWNPFAESQAAARLQRPGQRKQVYVVYFRMRGTMESYVTRVQRHKQQLLQFTTTTSSSSTDVVDESSPVVVEEEAQLFDYRVTVEM